VAEGLGRALMTESARVATSVARLVSVLPDPFVEIDEVGVVTEWNPRPKRSSVAERRGGRSIDL